MTSLAPELARRSTNTEKVLALLRAKPMTWLPWREIADVGGVCAWRTRISEARRLLKAEGGKIENRLLKKNSARSAYRYVPYIPQGTSAETPRERRLF